MADLGELVHRYVGFKSVGFVGFKSVGLPGANVVSATGSRARDGSCYGKPLKHTGAEQGI